MRHRGETTEFAGRRIGEEQSPITPEPLRAADSDEWAWMVDEDPAFYLSKPKWAENAGA